MKSRNNSDPYKMDVLTSIKYNAEQHPPRQASRNVAASNPQYVDENMLVPPLDWSEARGDVYAPLRDTGKLFFNGQDFNYGKRDHYTAYNRLWFANHKLPTPERQLAYLQANKLAQHSQFKGLNLNHSFNQGNGAGHGTQTGGYNFEEQRINLAPITAKNIQQYNPAQDFNHESGHAASDLGQHFYKQIGSQSPKTYRAMQDSIDTTGRFRKAYHSDDFSPRNRDRRPGKASVDEFAGYAFGNIGRKNAPLSNQNGQAPAKKLYEHMYNYINDISAKKHSYAPLREAIKTNKNSYDQPLHTQSIQGLPMGQSQMIQKTPQSNTQNRGKSSNTNIGFLGRIEQINQQKQLEEQKQEENAQENSFIKKARGGEVTRLDLYRALAASISPYNTYSDLI